jgi:hypothetical protein
MLRGVTDQFTGRDTTLITQIRCIFPKLFVKYVYSSAECTVLKCTMNGVSLAAEEVMQHAEQCSTDTREDKGQLSARTSPIRLHAHTVC